MTKTDTATSTQTQIVTTTTTVIGAFHYKRAATTNSAQCSQTLAALTILLPNVVKTACSCIETTPPCTTTTVPVTTSTTVTSHASGPVDAHSDADPDAVAARVDQQMEDAEGGIEGSLLDAPDTDTNPPT